MYTLCVVCVCVRACVRVVIRVHIVHVFCTMGIYYRTRPVARVRVELDPDDEVDLTVMPCNGQPW